MCGICGIYNFSQEVVNKDILLEMNNEMLSRGPDSDGHFIHKNFGMAMRRLSIIDIKNSIQPMQDNNNNISVIFNGEIYNYIELRRSLEKKGKKFKTNGDTEIILKLYELYEEKMVDYLNGMFAISIYDIKKKKLLLIRDRFGIKPIYYIKNRNQFTFSSSLNSLKKFNKNIKKSKESFLIFLMFNYFPNTKTVYEDVISLEPGHMIKIENNKFEKKRYFDPKKSISNFQYKRNNFLNFKDLIDNSIKINLRSDVKVGLMLSSGIDSNIIAYEASNNSKDIKCFSVDFEGKVENESLKAKSFAKSLSLEHETINISKDQIKSNLADIIKQMDEPCGDSSIIPSYLISKIAKDQDIKVLLSGAGGDELFAGYSRHYKNISSFFYGTLSLIKKRDSSILKLLPYKIQNIIFKCFSKKYSYVCNTSGQNLGVLLNVIKNSKDRDYILNYIEELLINNISENLSFNSEEVIMTDIEQYLPNNILMPFDKVTMINSVEGRVPLLDHRIIELKNSLNLDLVANSSFKNNKKILRSLYYDKLPKHCFEDIKKGFNAPITKWENIFEEFDDEFYFNETLNTKIIKRDYHKKNLGSFIYNLNTYNMWSNFN